MKRIFIAIQLFMVFIAVSAQSFYPGMFDNKQVVAGKAKNAVQCFPLSDIRLLPSRFKDNMRRDSSWMISLPVASLVHSFQVTAGINSGREGGYMTVEKLGGWESLDCELRGHAVGHLLSALSIMYASTGDSVFRAKGDSIVDALKEVQECYGTGYLSAFPEQFINRNIAGKSVWAPWYTLHKILSGLIDQYLYASNAKAFDIACGIGNWAYRKLSVINDSVRRVMLRNEFGGINESFYNLYALTGDERYASVAKFFYHNDVIDPLKQQNADFGTKHTNTFIPKVIAEARAYELFGNDDSRKAAVYFFQKMLADHVFVTGSLSDKEHFFAPSAFSQHLSGYTGETCCTYNMLKLARHLFCWSADIDVAEYYERALFNQILGQQDPETGMVCYFLPLLNGAFKVYSTPKNSFWCCVGSGFESQAKYAEGIYYHTSDAVLVNLFIPSVLKWREKGMILRQETAFPQSSSTTISIETASPKQATICIRYPKWSGKAVVKINGKPMKLVQSNGTYIKISRKWRNNDRIEAQFPMQISAETAHEDSSRVALLYGPIVLAGQMGTVEKPFSDSKKYNDYYSFDYNVPNNLNDSLAINIKNPSASLKSVAQNLTYVTREGITLKPLFDTHHQRYVVYWKARSSE